MNNLQLTFAANISYSGLTYNTRLLVEYKHTGKQFFTKKKGQNYNTCTTDEDIANGWISKGLKVTTNEGYYFVYRLAIPTINDKGQKHYWYINNDGDSYKVNKTSKYFKKIHSIISTTQKPITQKLKTNTA